MYIYSDKFKVFKDLLKCLSEPRHRVHHRGSSLQSLKTGILRTLKSIDRKHAGTFIAQDLSNFHFLL